MKPGGEWCILGLGNLWLMGQIQPMKRLELTHEGLTAHG